MKKVFIETYGCQMNEYDTELVKSILKSEAYEFTGNEADADVILMNTCAIREGAHTRIYAKLGDLKRFRRDNKKLVVGLLGCMAQNLRGDLERSENIVDIYAGPDSYKRLPDMIEAVRAGSKKEYDFSLSEFEDYSDVYPERVPGVNAWIAVMRGCDNFCTFCVVPYTRGRERSRTLESVVREAEKLAADGFKQVTLLGQNVNSYKSSGTDFADLMVGVAEVKGIERVRFTSPHPKDFPDKFLRVMAENRKICSHIHLPLQAGNDRVLELMSRSYTKSDFLELTDKIRTTVPEVKLTTDIIVGFPTETDEEFEDTLDVMRQVEFDSAFMFKYSQRKDTIAYRKYPDDVSEQKKTERIVKVNEMQKQHSLARNRAEISAELQILMEGPSKRTEEQWIGRTDGNKVVVVDRGTFQKGDLISCEITGASPNTLFGKYVDGVFIEPGRPQLTTI